jgi:hypothetical protein
MLVGIVFAAHKYYHDMGGQGFMKMRRRSRNSKTAHPPDIYLPLRNVQSCNDDESLLIYGVGYIRRWGENVPFYTCGDQQHSCEAVDLKTKLH